MNAISSPDALLTQALHLYQSGQLSAAARLCQQVLRQAPDAIAALHLMGLIAAQQQQLPIAIAFYRRVLAIAPHHLEAHNNLGIALMGQGDAEGAIAHYQQALALQPDLPALRVNLGNALQEQGDLAGAVAQYQQAIQQAPDLAAAHKNLAHVLRSQGDWRAALSAHERAIALAPHDADAHFGYAFTLLLGGDWQNGFREYEWRWRLPYNSPRTYSQPRWDGSPLAGRTLFVYAEQGLGDTLQFIRYAPLLAQQGRVVVECQPPLRRLLQTISGIDRLIVPGERAEFDCHAPLLSLPHLLGTSIATVPNRVPYLTPPAPRSLPVPPQTRLKVGFAWTGDPKNPINRRRSCPLAQFLKLLSLPGIALYSLQKGAETAEQVSHPQLIDLSAVLHDFGDTAAVVAQLDLVISIDTAVAHLAGAMGRPVWVILPFAPDWRWMLDRLDTPWYPTMHLFRQPQPGNWEAVFTDLLRLLTVLAASKSESVKPA